MLKPIASTVPSTPEVSLLSSAAKFPAEETGVDERGVPKWRTGISFRAIEAQRSAPDTTCRAVDAADRFSPATDGLIPEFVPHISYFPYGCEGFVDDDMEDEMTDEAKAKVRSDVAFHVARELWTGEITGNPSLQSPDGDGTTRDAVLVQDDAGVSPTTAVGLCIASWEECARGGIAMIHCPSVLVQDLVNTGMASRVGSRFLTPHGHIVVPGPGYPQSANSGEAWGPRTTANPDGEGQDEGEAWIYVSSIVEVDGPYTVETQNLKREKWAPRENRFEIVAEEWTAYRFDPGCVFAVKATIPT